MRYKEHKHSFGCMGKHRLHERKEGLVKEATEHIPQLKTPKFNHKRR